MRTVVQECPCQGKTLMRMVQPIILSILAGAPCHGYGIIQQIARTKLWEQSIPDPAGIYRTLREMEKRGLITSQPGNDAGGIGRRVFTLTEEGALCKQSWRRTLLEYQEGVREVIALLGPEEADTAPCCPCIEAAVSSKGGADPADEPTQDRKGGESLWDGNFA